MTMRVENHWLDSSSKSILKDDAFVNLPLQLYGDIDVDFNLFCSWKYTFLDIMVYSSL